jgi:hypothetical protein
LLLEGENVGPEALRQAEKFYVTEEQFEEFLQRHKHIPFLVAESNVKVVSIERYVYSVMYTDLSTLIHHFKDHNNFDLQNSLAGSIINLSSKGILLNETKTAKGRVGRKQYQTTFGSKYMHRGTAGHRPFKQGLC